jgi:hypothetical protein
LKAAPTAGPSPLPATARSRAHRRATPRRASEGARCSGSRLATPENVSRVPAFGKHHKHRVLSACGIRRTRKGKGAKGDATAAMSIRCLENIDLRANPATHFDGSAPARSRSVECASTQWPGRRAEAPRPRQHRGDGERVARCAACTSKSTNWSRRTAAPSARRVQEAIDLGQARCAAAGDDAPIASLRCLDASLCAEARARRAWMASAPPRGRTRRAIRARARGNAPDRPARSLRHPPASRSSPTCSRRACRT